MDEVLDGRRSVLDGRRWVIPPDNIFPLDEVPKEVYPPDLIFWLRSNAIGLNLYPLELEEELRFPELVVESDAEFLEGPNLDI